MSLGNELLQVVRTEKITEALCDVAELPLDAAIDMGAVKDLPFLGTLLKIYGGILSVRDRVFLQKIARFLRALRLVTEYEKQEFLRELENQGTRQRVGDKLIMLIEAQNDFEKAELLGVLFEAYIKRYIDRGIFERLAHAVTMTYIDDLLLFKEKHYSPLLSEARGAALQASGLSILEVEAKTIRFGGTQRGDMVNKYYYSAIGSRLNEILIGHYA